MKLMCKIMDRMHEECPGYWTVYGEDDVSIGAAVATDVDGYYWYYGSDKIVAVDATIDDIKTLCAVFGEPSTQPAGKQVPRESYDSKDIIVDDKAAAIEAYEVKLGIADVKDAEAVTK